MAPDRTLDLGPSLAFFRQASPPSPRGAVVRACFSPPGYRLALGVAGCVLAPSFSWLGGGSLFTLRALGVMGFPLGQVGGVKSFILKTKKFARIYFNVFCTFCGCQPASPAFR